ncbi:MAG TPA: stage II sporulation protein M, partial [Actinomycetota bacterium]|nr:stage II sporulation protein M [Actinomycetota bacterium]
MDIDAYVAAHRGEWDRLEQLLRRAGRGRGRLEGAEVDELVALYQTVTTHLSVVRSSTPDPALLARLSTLVARARSAVTGSSAPAWRDLARFFTITYPAALYRSMRWWAAVGIAFALVGLVVGVWVAGDAHVQATIAAPDEIRQLVQHDFEEYYSSAPAGSFAAKVATNNAWVSALALALGVFLLPVVWLLWQNALNVGVAGGLMAANDRLGLFFGLILPHGLLELTCVFVASGAGLRLGWSWIDPGARTRSRALREEGQAAGALALGLAATLMVSGVVEAFVTPSGLPTWARIGIGASLWLAFLAYAVVLGGRAVRAGELGDVR